MNSTLTGFQVDNVIAPDQAAISKSYRGLHITVGGQLLEQLGWGETTLVGVLVDQTGYRIALAPDRRGAPGEEIGTAFGDDPCPPRQYTTPVGPKLERVYAQERWDSGEIVLCAARIPVEEGEAGNVVHLHPPPVTEPGVLLVELPRTAGGGSATLSIANPAMVAPARSRFTSPVRFALAATAALSLVIGLVVGAILVPLPRYPVQEPLPLAPAREPLYVPAVPGNQAGEKDQEDEQGGETPEIAAKPQPALQHAPALLAPHAVRNDRGEQR